METVNTNNLTIDSDNTSVVDAKTVSVSIPANTKTVTVPSSTSTASVKMPTKKSKTTASKKVSAKSKTKKETPDKKTQPVKPRHLIIGKHISSDTGWSFSYSESSTLREVLIDFANTIDSSTNKRRVSLYANILNRLNGPDNIALAFDLTEEIFNYKIVFIAECSKIFVDRDFTKELVNKMNSINEPLPF